MNCIQLVTFSDMLSLFKASYTPSPEAVLLNRMYDVKEWLKPINPSLHNISNLHMFVIWGRFFLLHPQSAKILRNPLEL